jgi:hypothetical protein
MLPLNAPIPLSLCLVDKASSLYVKADVFVSDNTPMAGSPFTLVHTSNGVYLPASYPLMPGWEWVRAVYSVWGNAGFTIPSSYEQTEEKFYLASASASSSDGSALVGIIVDDNLVSGQVSDDDLVGEVAVDLPLTSIIGQDNVYGTVSDDEINGAIEGC